MDLRGVNYCMLQGQFEGIFKENFWFPELFWSKFKTQLRDTDLFWKTQQMTFEIKRGS